MDTLILYLDEAASVGSILEPGRKACLRDAVDVKNALADLFVIVKVNQNGKSQKCMNDHKIDQQNRLGYNDPDALAVVLNVIDQAI